MVKKGWIIHNVGRNGQPGEIIVDYDAIYKSEKGNTENTPYLKTEKAPSFYFEDTPTGNIENTYNNISTEINPNSTKKNKINSQTPIERGQFADEYFKFKI